MEMDVTKLIEILKKFKAEHPEEFKKVEQALDETEEGTPEEEAKETPDEEDKEVAAGTEGTEEDYDNMTPEQIQTKEQGKDALDELDVNKA